MRQVLPATLGLLALQGRPALPERLVMSARPDPQGRQEPQVRLALLELQALLALA